MLIRHHARRLPALALAGSLAACSGTSTGPLFTDSDAGSSGSADGSSNSSSGGPALLPNGSPDNPLATGTFEFTLDGAHYSIPGLVQMNGSGNMQVVFADKVSEGELHIGNGTYDGPGTHSFSAQVRDGSFQFAKQSVKYTVGDSKGAAQTTCKAVVTQAPPGSFPAKGSEIRGTLACTNVLRFEKNDKGKFPSDPNGTTALTDGTFAMLVR